MQVLDIYSRSAPSAKAISNVKSLLHSLHWLSVQQRILYNYRMAPVTFKVQRTSTPANCVRNLRSSGTPLLFQPFTGTDFAKRAGFLSFSTCLQERSFSATVVLLITFASANDVWRYCDRVFVCLGYHKKLLTNFNKLSGTVDLGKRKKLLAHWVSVTMRYYKCTIMIMIVLGQEKMTKFLD